MGIDDLGIAGIRCNRNQCHIGIRINQRQFPLHTGGFHNVESELIMADAIDNQHIHFKRAAHIFGTRSVVVWIAVRPDKRNDSSPVLNNVGDETVVGMKRNAYAQRLGLADACKQDCYQEQRQRTANDFDFEISHIYFPLRRSTSIAPL